MLREACVWCWVSSHHHGLAGCPEAMKDMSRQLNLVGYENLTTNRIHDEHSGFIRKSTLILNSRAVATPAGRHLPQGFKGSSRSGIPAAPPGKETTQPPTNKCHGEKPSGNCWLLVRILLAGVLMMSEWARKRPFPVAKRARDMG